MKKLPYCVNCGEKIAEDAYFCPKCGTKTEKGRAESDYPFGELRDAFYSVGIELEKAFTIAAKETHAAIQKAKENLQQKPVWTDTIVCSKCTAKNPSSAVFCNSCGNKIGQAQEPNDSA